ncbi:hypothetical protein DCS_05388 [Drechmeria coniospora]|uniref:Uncharacterized protein n=1 Tax=Drechmeria coniospora TaxID=98403 RepID=A0A151GMN6_DRECN|nr:hypothetical protein DCS_05388 [Drechmeria coniospora]KYK58375.1 hypothetical protein DCS_05388 [Drechmeria coniospora]
MLKEKNGPGKSVKGGRRVETGVRMDGRGRMAEETKPTQAARHVAVGGGTWAPAHLRCFVRVPREWLASGAGPSSNQAMAGGDETRMESFFAAMPSIALYRARPGAVCFRVGASAIGGHGRRGVQGRGASPAAICGLPPCFARRFTAQRSGLARRMARRPPQGRSTAAWPSREHRLAPVLHRALTGTLGFRAVPPCARASSSKQAPAAGCLLVGTECGVRAGDSALPPSVFRGHGTGLRLLVGALYVLVSNNDIYNHHMHT